MSTLPHVSVLEEVQTAIITALRADAALGAWLHERPASAPDSFARVYADGTVPANLRGRWVALGDAAESWANAFMRGGSLPALTIHLWHTPVAGDDVGPAISYRTWAHVARVLSGVLPLAGGHVMLSGVPSLVVLLRDPDGESRHGTVRYDSRTRTA